MISPSLNTITSAYLRAAGVSSGSLCQEWSLLATCCTSSMSAWCWAGTVSPPMNPVRWPSRSPSSWCTRTGTPTSSPRGTVHLGWSAGVQTGVGCLREGGGCIPPSLCSFQARGRESSDPFQVVLAPKMPGLGCDWGRERQRLRVTWVSFQLSLQVPCAHQALTVRVFIPCHALGTQGGVCKPCN